MRAMRMAARPPVQSNHEGWADEMACRVYSVPQNVSRGDPGEIGAVTAEPATVAGLHLDDCSRATRYRVTRRVTPIATILSAGSWRVGTP